MSLPRYQAYKSSGIAWLGDVPTHWDIQPLKRACRVFPSNVDKKSYEGEEPVRLCNYTDVYYNDIISGDMPFMDATATGEQVEKFTLRAGDTIVTKDSETADDIAISAYVPDDLPGVVCGYHLSMIRPASLVEGRFIKRLFDSAYTKACCHVSANGLTRVGLGQYALDNLVLPFPPKGEQSIIAEFLDRETAKIDTLIAEQVQLIALLKEKRQAVISHAVTKGLAPDAPMKDSGIKWLGKVPAHWEVLAVRRVIRTIQQGWSPECESRPAEANEWAVLKAGCVNRGVYSEDDNKALPSALSPAPEYEVRAGDLLMSRASGSPELVGSVALVESTRPLLMLSDKIFRITTTADCLPRYFAAAFNSTNLRAQIEQAISGAEGLANNLPQSSMKAFYVPLPPVAEQDSIVDYLNRAIAKLTELSSSAEIAISLLQERRTALISTAVTGKIKVCDESVIREAA